MERRNFLTLIGASAVAPLLPAMPAMAAPQAVKAAVGYNRYQYGLGVFHAQTRASLDVATLAQKMHLSLETAQSMMGEMISKGHVMRLGEGGVVQALNQTPMPKYSRMKARLDSGRELMENILRSEEETENSEGEEVDNLAEHNLGDDGL